MALMHRFVGQHGLPHHIANRKDVRHVGTHLLVHVDEATFGDIHTRFVSGNLLAVGCATHGLQHQVVQLWRGCAHAFECHFNALGHGAC